jgi:hypothetical protein
MLIEKGLSPVGLTISGADSINWAGRYIAFAGVGREISVISHRGRPYYCTPLSALLNSLRNSHGGHSLSVTEGHSGKVALGTGNATVALPHAFEHCQSPISKEYRRQDRHCPMVVVV